jgi:hypothetical protein
MENWRRCQTTERTSQNREFPCKIPCLQGICLETGAISTASPARESCSNSHIPFSNFADTHTQILAYHGLQ